MARQETQDPGAQRSAARLSDLVAKQRAPMLFVAALSVGEREKNLAFLPGTPSRQIPVHRRLCLLIGQILAPAAQFGRRRMLPFGRDRPLIRCLTTKQVAVHIE